MASESKDINFIILLAGPGIRGDKILLLQQELIARASGTPESKITVSKDINTKVFNIILASDDTKMLQLKLKDTLTTLFNGKGNQLLPQGMNAKKFIATQITQLTSPLDGLFYQT